MINSLIEISVVSVLMQFGREEYQPEGFYWREQIFYLEQGYEPISLDGYSNTHPPLARKRAC
jgi:hypothetical protein